MTKRKAHPNEISEKRQQQIISEYKAGKSITEIIGKGLGDFRTVKKTLIRNGVVLRQRNRAHNFNDLTGKVFGRLTVTKLSHIENYASAGKIKRRTWWECKCSCGSVTTLACVRLVTSNTKSCGCLKKERLASYNRGAKGKPEGSSAMHALYLRYRAMADSREYTWGLSEDYFKLLCSKDCFYCGASPSCIAKGFRSSATYNGIDRFDNNKGYTVENCVPCCKACNQGKMATPPEEWIEKCIKIANRFAGMSYAEMLELVSQAAGSGGSVLEDR